MFEAEYEYNSHESQCEELYEMDSCALTSKKRKLNEDERLKRCRERNRVHARNTRERKKLQLETLQAEIQELMNERTRLKNQVNDTSVASILMLLAGCDGEEAAKNVDSIAGDESPLTRSASMYANMAIDKLRIHISAEFSGEEDFDLPQTPKDKSACSVAEIESIRRERNRMHAKKTRFRKKKMLQEMATICDNLKADIRKLKSRDHTSQSHLKAENDSTERVSNFREHNYLFCDVEGDAAEGDDEGADDMVADTDFVPLTQASLRDSSSHAHVSYFTGPSLNALPHHRPTEAWCPSSCASSMTGDFESSSATSSSSSSSSSSHNAWFASVPDNMRDGLGLSGTARRSERPRSLSQYSSQQSSQPTVSHFHAPSPQSDEVDAEVEGANDDEPEEDPGSLSEGNQSESSDFSSSHAEAKGKSSGSDSSDRDTGEVKKPRVGNADSSGGPSETCGGAGGGEQHGFGFSSTLEPTAVEAPLWSGAAVPPLQPPPPQQRQHQSQPLEVQAAPSYSQVKSQYCPKPPPHSSSSLDFMHGDPPSESPSHSFPLLFNGIPMPYIPNEIEASMVGKSHRAQNEREAARHQHQEMTRNIGPSRVQTQFPASLERELVETMKEDEG